MAFESVVVRKGAGGSPTGRDVMGGLGYSYNDQTPEEDKAAKHRARVCFSIGMSILKSARFIVGDRLDLLYDPESGLGLIKRVPNGSNAGMKLSASGPNSALIAITPRPEEAHRFPKTKTVLSLENVSVEDQGILFTWPRPAGQASLPLPVDDKFKQRKAGHHGK